MNVFLLELEQMKEYTRMYIIHSYGDIYQQNSHTSGFVNWISV